MVFVGVAQGDGEKDSAYLARRVVNLRVFPDEESKFNLSALDVGAELLVISQFTLLAQTRKGHRPSFTEAAPPAEAEPLFESFISHLAASGLRVERGVFQRHLLVEIHNDGPVTVLVESKT